MATTNSTKNASLFSSDSMPIKKGKKILVQTEKELTKQICLYIKAQYPSVYFFTDPSGMFQKSWAAKTMLKNNRSKHAQLDLIILHSVGAYKGCMIELKRESENLYKKDKLTFASKHLEDQFNSITCLIKNGYFAAFGIGFEKTKNIIDLYLNNQIDYITTDIIEKIKTNKKP